jgi:hypothetical protein
MCGRFVHGPKRDANCCGFPFDAMVSLRYAFDFLVAQLCVCVCIYVLLLVSTELCNNFLQEKPLRGLSFTPSHKMLTDLLSSGHAGPLPAPTYPGKRLA